MVATAFDYSKMIVFIFFCVIFLVTPSLCANHFSGITVSNSIGGVKSYACRSQTQWNVIASNVKNSGFPSIRIVGFDCDALDRASTAAETYGITILAGAYISGSIASSLPTLKKDIEIFRAAYVKYGSRRYVGFVIGNEVNDSPKNIMAEVHKTRDDLRGHGIATPISTVHTWVKIRDNPSFCDADFVGANAHAFFDGSVKSADSGKFISQVVLPSLRRSCPGKNIIITESGWPSQGGRNGVASPLFFPSVWHFSILIAQAGARKCTLLSTMTKVGKVVTTNGALVYLGSFQ